MPPFPCRSSSRAPRGPRRRCRATGCRVERRHRVGAKAPPPGPRTCRRVLFWRFAAGRPPLPCRRSRAIPATGDTRLRLPPGCSAPQPPGAPRISRTGRRARRHSPSRCGPRRPRRNGAPKNSPIPEYRARAAGRRGATTAVGRRPAAGAIAGRCADPGMENTPRRVPSIRRWRRCPRDSAWWTGCRSAADGCRCRWRNRAWHRNRTGSGRRPGRWPRRG